MRLSREGCIILLGILAKTTPNLGQLLEFVHRWKENWILDKAEEATCNREDAIDGSRTKIQE